MTPRRKRLIYIAVAIVLSMVFATGLDPLIEQWGNTHGHLRYNSDLLRLLRVAGYAPAWLAIAVCLMLTDRRARLARWWDRGALVVLSVFFTATSAEIIKLIVRRERPHNALDHGLFFSFRSYLDAPLSSSGIGFPSSHAAVAFGGAFMLARVTPATWPVVVLWASACAATRVLSGAHYLSDAVGAAIVGYACSTLLWSMHCRRTTRAGVPTLA